MNENCVSVAFLVLIVMFQLARVAEAAERQADAKHGRSAEEKTGAKPVEPMRILKITGDSERIVIRFSKGLDKKLAEDPGLYDVGGQRPARVQATGFYAILKGVKLSPEQHRIRISQNLVADDGAPLTAESREATYRYKYPRRRIKVSAIQPLPNWQMKLPLSEYLRYIMELVDEAGRRGSDIVCLPEAVMYEPGRDVAQPIPDGEYPRLLAERARRHKMYINAVVHERRGPRIGETALLLDRQGKVAGKYHKVFELGGQGILEGELLPVFETDFGVIGSMICFDMISPEAPRILTLKGAEIIFIPHGVADAAGTELHQVLMAQAYAVTNEVYVVFNGFGREIDRSPRDLSNNFGRTCVIGRNGMILADAGHIAGVVSTDIDLEARRFVAGYGMAGIKDAREALLRCVKLNVHEELLRVAKEVVARNKAAGIPNPCDWEEACRVEMKQAAAEGD